MSNKSLLYDALNKFPSTINTNVFPTLTVPPVSATVEDAIINSANAQREMVTFLNTYATMRLRDLLGMIGMLSPSAQAIAMSLLQSNGEAATGSTIETLIQLIGSESDGGYFTALFEPPAKREDTADGFGMLESAIALVPAVANYSGFLTPLISLAVELYSKPGQLGVQVGMILFQQVCDFIKQIILNELYDADAPAQVDSQALKRIAEALWTIPEGEEEDPKSIFERLATLLEEISDQDEIINVDDLIVMCRAQLVEPA